MYGYGEPIRKFPGIKLSDLPSDHQAEGLVALLDDCEEKGEKPSVERLRKVGLGTEECRALFKLEENKDSAVKEAVDDFCFRLQSVASPNYKENTDFYNSLSRMMEKELAPRKKDISNWNAEVFIFKWGKIKFSSKTACQEVYAQISAELDSDARLRAEIWEDRVQKERYLKKVLGEYIAEKKGFFDLTDTPLSRFSSAVQNKVAEAIFPTPEELRETRGYTHLSYLVAELLAGYNKKAA